MRDRDGEIAESERWNRERDWETDKEMRLEWEIGRWRDRSERFWSEGEEDRTWSSMVAGRSTPVMPRTRFSMNLRPIFWWIVLQLMRPVDPRPEGLKADFPVVQWTISSDFQNWFSAIT
jgi:hypothetical protein